MEADSAGPEKPFVCDFCPKKYLRKNNLEDHILMEHPDTEQILAEIGNLHLFDGSVSGRTKGPKRSRSSGRRVAVVRGAGRRRVAVVRGAGRRRVGGDTARASDIIKYKARNGRSKGSLIVECEICSKRFRYQSDLKNHYESHFRGRGRGSRGGPGSRSIGASTKGVSRGQIQPGGRGSSPRGSRLRGAAASRGSPAERAGGVPETSRTRPCLYCGKTFLQDYDLEVHEEAEALEFEKEAMHFENDHKMKNQPMFEHHTVHLHHVIDRTDEEFGDEYRFPEDLKVDTTINGHMEHTLALRQAVCPGEPVSLSSSVNTMQSPPAEQMQQTAAAASLAKPMYNNHTSQYTSLDPVCSLYQGTSCPTPPPAHEDPTTLHGFFPPPPPLPIPQFSQVYHKRSEVEFSDPNEDKTYTRLQSKDESQTRSSLLQVNSMSPSREVLDLSLPKPSVKMEDEREEAEHSVDAAEASVKQEVKLDSNEPRKEVKEELVQEELIVFEPNEVPQNGMQSMLANDEPSTLSNGIPSMPSNGMPCMSPNSMPSMPDTNISCPESFVKTERDPLEIKTEIDADWKPFSDEYLGLINPDEEVQSSRSQSPLQFDDPNRIDCKYCGMIFTAPHVRKFHETSHVEERAGADVDPGRLHCALCMKTFKKVTYRILHEKGHTGDSTDRTCKSPSKNKLFRHADKDDWIENHPSMPTGWKMRSRPRPNQEGQSYYIFLSPEKQVFHSRKSVLIHMEKSGGYSIEDLNKVRKSAKTGPRLGPRGRRGRGGGFLRNGERSFSEMNNESNLDSTDLDCSDIMKKETETEDTDVEGWEESSLPTGWKVRIVAEPSGETKFEFMSPENHVFTSKREVLRYMSKKKGSEEMEEDPLNDNGIEMDVKPFICEKEMDVKPFIYEKEIDVKPFIPKPKRLVTNQTMISKKILSIRREVIDSEELPKDTFRHEPVIFVPRLVCIVKNMDLEETLSTTQPAAVRIPINCIHSDEGLGNSIDEIKEELKERQLDFARSLCDEDYDDSADQGEHRTLRFKQRRNYEEMDDEVFQALISKSKLPMAIPEPPEEEEGGDAKGKERNRFSEEETRLLEKWFNRNPYPNNEEREVISEMMKIPIKKVRIWFQNKRCKTDDGKMKCFFARNNLPNSDTESDDDEIQICKECKQTFLSKIDFKIHLKRVHGTDGEKIVCKECITTFDTMWNLKTHYIEEHSKSDMDLEFSSNDEGGRTKFSKSQIITLRNAFAANPYPEKEVYKKLGETLNISNKILHSWFQNHRHREKITARYSTSNQSEYLDECAEEWWRNGEDDDPKAPYNPGHKKTKFTEHQRNYLHSFFTEKEYVDEDDISDLSAELMLTPKVIRIWFQHARERKKKNLPILPAIRVGWRGRGLGRSKFVPSGRPRGRPPKNKLRESEEDYYFMDEDSLSHDVPSKVSDDNSFFEEGGSNSESTNGFTEFQKVFLTDFYSDISNPDSDDLDYLCEHINVSRDKIIQWFEERNKLSDGDSPPGAYQICAEIVDRLICELNVDCEPSSSGYESGEFFSCPYCGKSFPEAHLLREHEKLEAIEFEKEALKFKETDIKCEDEAYVTLEDDPEESMQDSFEETELDELYNDYMSLDEHEDEYDDECFQEAEHVKRPLNPFMIWLQEERKKLQAEGAFARSSKSTGELVRDLSLVWKAMSEFDKMPYIEESRRLKELHRQEYPNYTFTPHKKKSPADPNRVKVPRRANLIKSYLCKRCQVGFTTKGNLFKHLRHFHADNPYDPNFYELGNEKNRERNLLRCDKCNMDFISKIGLARHMLKIHNQGVEVKREGHFAPVFYEDDTNDFDSMDSIGTDYSVFRGSDIDFSEPVSSSSDRFYDDEYERRAHVKTRFSPYQKRVLLDNFHRSITMSKCDAKKLYFSLADRLQLPAKIVRIWFQNARSARKRGKPLFSD